LVLLYRFEINRIDNAEVHMLRQSYKFPYRYALIVCVVLMVFALPTVVWATEAYITQSDVTSIELTWKYYIGSPVVASLVNINGTSSQPLEGVGAENGTFYVFNAATGTLQWTLNTGGPITQTGLSYTFGSNTQDWIYIVSGDGCAYAALSQTGALQWKTCFGSGVSLLTPTVGPPSGTASGVAISYVQGSTVTTQDLNAATGAALSAPSNATYSPTAITVSPIGYQGQTLYYDPDTGKYSCQSVNAESSYTVSTAGSTLYLRSPSGSIQSLSFSAPVTALPGTFAQLAVHSQTAREPNGLLITCTEFANSEELFYPVNTGAVPAVTVLATGNLYAGGSENVSASAFQPFFVLDESNSFGTTGVLFVNSSNVMKAILIPQGSVYNVFTAQGTISDAATGDKANGYSFSGRVYFGDSAGYVYAISPNGQ
jgi:outer membrane protein assembly factor BamB